MNLFKEEKIYEGKHNRVYLFSYFGNKYIYKVAKFNNIYRQNKINFLKNNETSILVTKNIHIRKYCEGKNLTTKNSFKILSQIKYNLITNYWYSNIDLPIENNNILMINIDDKKYHKLIKKYNNHNDYVICHNDLRPKNIIKINNNINIIDNEWVMKNDKYFDLAHLYLYCKFSKKAIKKIFRININKLNDFIYIVEIFNKWYEAKEY